MQRHFLLLMLTSGLAFVIQSQVAVALRSGPANTKGAISHGLATLVSNIYGSTISLLLPHGLTGT